MVFGEAILNLEKIVAVFSDIDGTLLNSKEELTEENVFALREAMKSGIHLVFASGRSTMSIRNVLPQEIESNNIIAFNGSEITVGGRLISRTKLDPLVASSITRKAFDNSIHIHAYIDDRLVFSEINNTAADYALHAGLEPVVVHELAEYLKTHAPTKLVIISATEEIPMVRNGFARDFPLIRFTRAGDIYLDVTSPAVDKGKALAIVCKELGISPKEAVAFGDSDNDIEMLKSAGVSVAMANGSWEAKKVATLIGPSNDENGFARVLMDLLQRQIGRTETYRPTLD
ncbi:MAG: HAD family hydrolase [Mesotoga sp.]|uniref:HAD family hydrolase n=1 Tax=Mesotoga sp. TaxID=2053577 RepID=UPI003569A554